MRLVIVSLSIVLSAFTVLAQNRNSSDFDLAKAKRSLEDGRPVERIAAHLNIGDIHRSRSDVKAARASYRAAKAAAEAERLRARKESELAQYARATSYSGLASAKLENRSEAIDLFEESVRYVVDSAANWNLYASAMLSLGDYGKSSGAARMAVAIGERDLGEGATLQSRLNLDVYRYTLASAIAGDGREGEAIAILETIVADLASSKFSSVREAVVREEEFEILSSVKSDASAYLSLLSRSRLKLGALYEKANQTELARREYLAVQKERNDDPTALAALARLSRGTEERDDRFLEAFEANPFNYGLALEYEKTLQNHPPLTGGEGDAATVRSVIEAVSNGELEKARTALARIQAKNRDNETIKALEARIEIARGNRDEAQKLAGSISDARIRNDLRARLDRVVDTQAVVASLAARETPLTATEVQSLIQLLSNPLSPEQQLLLDGMILQTTVRFDTATPQNGNTILESGRAGTHRIRFNVPTEIRGTFQPDIPLMLTFRPLGATTNGGVATLLVEPLGVTR